MNVYQRLLNILAETINPEYWTPMELCRYIREAQEEFVRRTRLLRRHTHLSQQIIPVHHGTELRFDSSYRLPEDLLGIESVQWQGRPLDKKSLRFMETRYSGTSEQQDIKGLGRYYERSWRTVTGSPVHWLFDNYSVLLFPNPQETPSVFVFSLDDIVDETAERIQLTSEPTEGQTFCIRADKTVGGLSYGGQWMALTSEQFSLCSDSDGRFYFEPSKALKRKLTDMSADGYSFVLTTFLPSEFATIDYIYRPAIEFRDILKEDGIDSSLDRCYDETVAVYAAFLALSKEGDKTQDLQKAKVYLDRFEEFCGRVSNLTDTEVDVDYTVNMPFVL